MVTAAAALYLAMWPLALLLPRNNEGDPMDGFNLVGIATLVYILVLISIGVWAQSAGPRRGVGSSGVT